jgi:hypothetical protein
MPTISRGLRKSRPRRAGARSFFRRNSNAAAAMAAAPAMSAAATGCLPSTFFIGIFGDVRALRTSILNSIFPSIRNNRIRTSTWSYAWVWTVGTFAQDSTAWEPQSGSDMWLYASPFDLPWPLEWRSTRRRPEPGNASASRRSAGETCDRSSKRVARPIQRNTQSAGSSRNRKPQPADAPCRSTRTTRALPESRCTPAARKTATITPFSRGTLQSQ